MIKEKQTYNPCDDCQYSYSKNGQESRMCKICEFTYFKDRKQSEWISVDERLPAIDAYGKGRYGGVRSVRVLCVCKQRDGRTFVKEGYYEPCVDLSVVWRIPGSIDSVTHWMPLPSPPTEKES